MIASGSCVKSIKIWNGYDGQIFNEKTMSIIIIIYFVCIICSNNNKLISLSNHDTNIW